MRALKAVVIALGVLIVLALGTIVITIAYRSSGSGADGDAPAARAGFSQLEVEVAPGTLIGQIELDGGRMAVHITKDIADEILIIDIDSGALVGRVTLRPTPSLDARTGRR